MSSIMGWFWKRTAAGLIIGVGAVITAIVVKLVTGHTHPLAMIGGALVFSIPCLFVYGRVAGIKVKKPDTVTHHEGQVSGSHVSLRPVTKGEIIGMFYFFAIWFLMSWLAIEFAKRFMAN